MEAGTYVGGIRVYKSLTLLGSGLPNVGTGDFLDGYGGAFEVGANSVTINGFNILGDGSGGATDNYGVLIFHGTSNTTIENNTIGAFNNSILTEDDGIAVDGQTGVTINNNHFNSTSGGDYAIYLDGTGGNLLTVQNNVFASDVTGILVQNVSQVSVVGNDFIAPATAVIVVDADHVTINANTLNNADGNGIAADGAPRVSQLARTQLTVPVAPRSGLPIFILARMHQMQTLVWRITSLMGMQWVSGYCQTAALLLMESR